MCHSDGIWKWSFSCTFHFHAAFACTDLPCHADSVSINARDHEIKHIFFQCVAGILFYHFRVGSETTGTDDDSVTLYIIFHTIFINCGQTGNDLILTVKGFNRSLKEILNAKFLPSFKDRLVHCTCASRARTSAIFRLYNVPGSFRLREILHCACKNNAHILKPVDRRTGIPEVVMDQVGIRLPVYIIHETGECFFLSQCPHLCFLQTALNAERSHTHIGSSARNTALFKTNDLKSFFGCSHAGTKTCRACSDYGNISINFFHYYSPFCIKASDVLLLQI